MLNPHFPEGSSTPCSLSFLQHNPALSSLLFADCNDNIYEVATVIDPVLTAQQRCQITPIYIQAVSTGRTSFLATNLMPERELKVTDSGSSWLLGRSPDCAIAIKHGTVSRRHAVVGRHEDGRFYITDLGSRNGTHVNNRRLPPTDRWTLQDGDLIRLGALHLEFFITSRQLSPQPMNDATCF